MKVNLRKLQSLINKDASLIYEGLNTAEAKKLYNSVISLYEEIASFEKEAPGSAINALSPQLRQVQEMLEKMLTEPLNYVSREEEDDSDFEEEESEDYVEEPEETLPEPDEEGV